MTRHDPAALGVFLLVSFGLAWLVALPLWLGDGLASPWFLPVSAAMMFTPAIGALSSALLVDRPGSRREVLRSLGIWPLPRAGRLIGYAALAVVVPAALVLVALPIGAVLGVYPADLTGLSGFREVLSAQLTASGSPPPPFPLWVLVVLQLVSIPVGALVNTIPAAGEEIGWRGWLLPRLLPLGTVPAILVSGIAWGFWHAPLILLGYNYPLAPGWLGVLAMTGMCTVVGAVFAWLRIRSESVWPAALAHGSLNAAAGSYVLFAQAGALVDTTQATVLGWTGWIAPVVLIGILAATGRFRRPAPTS
ncbi:CPBP family intramembrane glutamic endopeptidase [Brevibacterium litoralis]|uniref:CPBP family intramembrane glutamic endopeptidase n=1 Tax=Brevibacterium litoralis TaxID=3138935 RepID=UPI0032F027F2